MAQGVCFFTVLLPPIFSCCFNPWSLTSSFPWPISITHFSSWPVLLPLAFLFLSTGPNGPLCTYTLSSYPDTPQRCDSPQPLAEHLAKNSLERLSLTFSYSVPCLQFPRAWTTVMHARTAPRIADPRLSRILGKPSNLHGYTSLGVSHLCLAYVTNTMPAPPRLLLGA